MVVGSDAPGRPTPPDPTPPHSHRPLGPMTPGPWHHCPSVGRSIAFVVPSSSTSGAAPRRRPPGPGRNAILFRFTLRRICTERRGPPPPDHESNNRNDRPDRDRSAGGHDGGIIALIRFPSFTAEYSAVRRSDAVLTGRHPAVRRTVPTDRAEVLRPRACRPGVPTRPGGPPALARAWSRSPVGAGGWCVPRRAHRGRRR